MDNKHIHLLSTKLLGNKLTNGAIEGVVLECIPFIDILPVPQTALRLQLSAVSDDAFVIFTSMNAVRNVARITGDTPVWKVFCIAEATQKLVEQLFPGAEIAGSAADGRSLADRIIRQHPPSVVFFCGNKRLETIPAALKNAGIPLTEIVVYETAYTPVAVARDYDGVLFFSPSGADSFFRMNKMHRETVAFSIGPSTTKALQRYTGNIIQAARPDLNEMLHLAQHHFKINKNSNSV